MKIEDKLVIALFIIGLCFVNIMQQITIEKNELLIRVHAQAILNLQQIELNRRQKTESNINSNEFMEL